MGVDFNKFLIGVEIQDEHGSFNKVMQMVDKINATGTKGTSKAETDLRSKQKAFEKVFQSYTRASQAHETALKDVEQRFSNFARQSTLAKTQLDSTGKSIDGTTTSTKALGQAVFSTGQMEKMFNTINAAMTGQKKRDTKALKDTTVAVGALGKEVGKTAAQEKTYLKAGGLLGLGKSLRWTTAGLEKWKAIPSTLRNMALEGSKFLNVVNRLTQAGPRMLRAFDPARQAAYEIGRKVDLQARARSGYPQMSEVAFGSVRPGAVKEIGVRPRKTAVASSWVKELNAMGGEYVRQNLDEAMGKVFSSGIIPKSIISQVRKTPDSVRAKLIDMVKGFTSAIYDSYAEIGKNARQMLVQRVTGLVNKQFELGPPTQMAVGTIGADWEERLKRRALKASQTSGPMQLITSQAGMNIAALEQLAKVKFLAKAHAGSVNVGESMLPGLLQKGRGYIPGQDPGTLSVSRADDAMKEIAKTNEALTKLAGSTMGPAMRGDIGALSTGIMNQVKVTLATMASLAKNVNMGAIQNSDAMRRLNTLTNMIFISATTAVLEKSFSS